MAVKTNPNLVEFLSKIHLSKLEVFKILLRTNIFDSGIRILVQNFEASREISERYIHTHTYIQAYKNLICSFFPSRVDNSRRFATIFRRVFFLVLKVVICIHVNK